MAEAGRGVTLEEDAVWGPCCGKVENGDGGRRGLFPPQLRNLDFTLLATRSRGAVDRFIFRVTIGAVEGGAWEGHRLQLSLWLGQRRSRARAARTPADRQLHGGGAGGGSRVWKPTPYLPSGRLPIRHPPPSPLQSYLPGGANPPPALHGLLMLRWFQKGK